MSLASLLRETATILRPTGGTTASGVAKRDYATVADGVPCALQSPVGQMRQQDFGKADTSIWLGLFGADADLRRNDRVVRDGETFEVAELEDLRGHHLEATLRRVVA